MTRTYWDAEVYERIGTPMRRWAQQLIQDLALAGDETVLDAGCGSGSVTFDLLERLPNGKIYAVDNSPQMIEQLSSAVQERGIQNVTPILASLTDFSLPEQVDVVFSNAVLHWIPDDEALFTCLFRAAKPGGRFRAQCGGAGNIDHLMEATRAVEARDPYSQFIAKPMDPRKYRTPGEVTESMNECGWTDVKGNLFDSPVPFDNPDDASLYLRTVILQQQVEVLPDDLGQPFLSDVVAEIIERQGAPFVADYTRLDIWANRPC